MRAVGYRFTPGVPGFEKTAGNMPGGLPYTPWAADIKKQRMAVVQRVLIGSGRVRICTDSSTIRTR